MAYLAAQTLNDVDLRQELLRLFANQARRLRPVLLGQDDHARREAAHMLGGAALAVGARTLGDLLIHDEMLPADAVAGAIDAALAFADEQLAERAAFSAP